ncbi:unnamed protein product [Wuchereria bancrofti]|uniref:Cytoplasmic polyadenylation element-binding protein ZZ domain-containing protein n=1 Tax=Wuchereria bancrofti TaxID=6293 RepID=A0A3P7EB75_WUCBA|nr:unnamed protein product [Wuchereria bancrofti]
MNQVQVRPWYLSGSGCTLMGCIPFAYRVVELTLEVEYSTNYPKGSGRLVFATREAYLLALAVRHFTLTTTDGRKVILELRPYVLDRMLCEICYEAAGVYLCPYLPCFLYYCVSCWNFIHQYDGMGSHKPVSKRNLKFLKQNYIFHRCNNSMRRKYYRRFHQ